MNLKNVIIVEDEAINAMFLRHLLELGNYNVVDVLDNEPDAFKSIEAKKPSLVMVDIKLKYNTSGIELMKKVIDLLGPIPHIYCTSYSDESIIDDCRATNPIDIIYKPIDESVLFEAVNKTNKDSIS